MDWLNLHSSLLDSAEYVGSDTCERGTWLSLLRYCVGQENGGRIQNCNTWKDRQWQQLARVTLREVTASCRLFTWDGVDLIVWGYPAEKENEVKAKREIAKRNGRNGGRPKPETNVGSLSVPTLVNSPKAEGEEEGERKEKGKGKGNTELVGSAAPSALASSSSDLFGGIQQPATPPPPATKPKPPQQTDAEWLASLSASPAYAGIDIPREHAKATIWCQTKRKQLTRPRFVNWLNRIEKPMGSQASGARTAEDQARVERVLNYQPGL